MFSYLLHKLNHCNFWNFKTIPYIWYRWKSLHRVKHYNGKYFRIKKNQGWKKWRSQNLVKKTFTNLFWIYLLFYPFKHQPHKMVKHTQKIRRLLPEEFFECLSILWGWHWKDQCIKTGNEMRYHQRSCRSKN